MSTRSELSRRPRRSQDDLRSDSKTVRYELEMLLAVVESYANVNLSSQVVLKNALIESFALHCRAMIFFLFGHLNTMVAGDDNEKFGSLQPTDVLAYDFYPEWPNFPSPTKVLLRAKRQADKYVAHITIERREVNQPGSRDESVWLLGEIATEIAKVMDTFLRKVPASVIEVSELDRMNSLTSSWLTAHVASSPQPSTNPSPDHNRNNSLCGRTDAQTVSRPSGINFHGRTEQFE